MRNILLLLIVLSAFAYPATGQPQPASNQANEYFKRGTDLLNNQKDYDGAIANLTKAIELNGNYAEAYYNRGLARRQKGDIDGAIADYTAALRINPKYAEAHLARAIARELNVDQDGAILDYTL